MTPEQIDNLQPGRELDAEVHKAFWPRHNIQSFESLDLLLWHYCDGSHEKSSNCQWQSVPHYSTDIAGAWKVVEKLCARTPYGDIHIEHLDEQWSVSTCYDRASGGWDGFARADTAPLAICKAALKALVAKQDKEPQQECSKCGCAFSAADFEGVICPDCVSLTPY